MSFGKFDKIQTVEPGEIVENKRLGAALAMYFLTLTPLGEDVRGELELMDGFQGKIVARRVEVLDVDPL